MNNLKKLYICSDPREIALFMHMLHLIGKFRINIQLCDSIIGNGGTPKDDLSALEEMSV